MPDTAALETNSVRLFEASGGVWSQLRVEAMQAAAEEPLLASFLHATILHDATARSGAGILRR